MKQTANFFTAVAGAGLLAGILDGIAAIVNYSVKGGKDPAVIFKFIASGVFDKTAFTGGNTMVMWGVAFHLFIALCFALFYFSVFPKLKLLSKNILLSGFLYGMIVWMVMNLGVVPLSNTRKLTPDLLQKIIAMLILIIAVGLPIAMMAKRYYAKKNRRSKRSL